MVSLVTQIRFKLGVEPGLASAHFPFNTKLIGLLKHIPGCRWHAPRHCWMVPDEVVEEVAEAAKQRLGWVPLIEKAPVLPRLVVVNEQAYPYQREDIIRFLEIRRAEFAWEMGLGKTLGAIEAMRLSGAHRFLVVCPAMARGVWEDEVAKWWQGAPLVIVLRDGKEAARFALEYGFEQSWIVVTSYELLEKMRLPERLDFVVLDEAHYVKNARQNGRSVKRSALVRSILERHNVPWRLWLTGTPVTVNPIDIHNQVDLLYPGRLGSYWQFGDAYSGRVNNPHRQKGYDYVGVNTARAEELYGRLSAFVFRRTKGEVAQYLPPLTTQSVRVPSRRSGLLERLKTARPEEVEALLANVASEKIPHVVAMVQEDFEAGATHVSVASWLRETGEALAAALEGVGVPVYHVDGDLPEKKRTAVIKEVKAQEKAILVSTMASINVGINLSTFSPAYCAELYGAPGVMTQWAGRYHRIGGNASVIRFVVQEGMGDERIARTLTARLQAQGKVLDAGQMDNAVLTGIDSSETPAQVRARLIKTLSTETEEDAYGVA